MPTNRLDTGSAGKFPGGRGAVRYPRVRGDGVAGVFGTEKNSGYPPVRRGLLVAIVNDVLQRAG